MPPTAIVEHPAEVEHVSLAGVVPDSPAGLFGSFPDRAQVRAATASLDVLATSADWLRWTGNTYDPEQGPGFGRREGVVWRVEVSPGVIAVRRKDLRRIERTIEAGYAETDHQLQRGDYFRRLNAEVADKAAAEGRAKRTAVRCWSAKSRANMTRRLATLDYAPMLNLGTPAMITLTYPGDWLTVAPDAATSYGHVRKLLDRYRRAWGAPLVGVWKREFQSRGAPHWHIWAVPPTGRHNGRNFGQWLADTWTAIVGAESCGQPEPEWATVCQISTRKERQVIACCERHRHHASHSTAKTVDFREGARFRDPRRLAVYFSKHGLFSAKDYQNEAPREWLADPSKGIGRFWGYWGLEPLTGTVEVPPEVAQGLQRTLRRWQAATELRDNAGRPAVARRQVWRKKHYTVVDTTTGELVERWKWRKRWVKTRIPPRMRGRGGFLCVNDGPALALAVSRYASVNSS